MENPCQLKTIQVLLTTPDYDWERVGFWVNEGPAVIPSPGKDLSYLLGLGDRGLPTVWEC